MMPTHPPIRDFYIQIPPQKVPHLLPVSGRLPNNGLLLQRPVRRAHSLLSFLTHKKLLR